MQNALLAVSPQIVPHHIGEDVLTGATEAGLIPWTISTAPQISLTQHSMGTLKKDNDEAYFSSYENRALSVAFLPLSSERGRKRQCPVPRKSWLLSIEPPSPLPKDPAAAPATCFPVAP